MAVTAALVLSADASWVLNLKPRSNLPVDFPPGENLSVLPEMPAATDQGHAAPGKPSDKPSVKHNGPLQAESRLALVRFVDGEFVRVVTPLPAGKKGFHLKAGSPLDRKQLRQALQHGGAAANPGDRAQITNLQFTARAILVDINGGGRGKRHWRDHIHLDMGGIPTVQAAQQDDVPFVTPTVGATIFLDFEGSVPDMTPNDLKKYLSGMLDFSSQTSAAVQWVETLPPDIKKAIQDKRPAVGMDRDMVIAAAGRPDRKVRERGPDGIETEDWIYGKPPAKTIFVKFEGDKVIQVEQFPQ